MFEQLWFKLLILLKLRHGVACVHCGRYFIIKDYLKPFRCLDCILRDIFGYEISSRPEETK